MSANKIFGKKRLYGRSRKQRILDAAVDVAAVLAVIFLSAALIKLFTRPTSVIKAENAGAMRVPYETALMLRELSIEHKKDFEELLTVYMVDNNFFEMKTVPPSYDELLQKYVKRLGSLKNKYGKKAIEPYENIIRTIFREVRQFPVIENDGINRGYFYADNFGSMRSDGPHYAIDIIDRENVSGRLAVFSMTDGTITEIGISRTDGYHIGVTAESGNYYYYAHLHDIEDSLKKGSELKAGQLIGSMGNSGTSESEAGYAVRLHISILVNDPSKDKGQDGFYINPYIFLRFIEK